MPIRPSELVRLLVNKFDFHTAENRSTDHDWYELNLPDLPPILTKVSWSRDEIRDKLEGKIARQLRVRRSFYNGMMLCSNSREDYYRKVRDDPFPPWDVRF